MSNIKFFKSASNIYQTNKQVIKLWSLSLDKQKIGPTISFPGGFENTPFKMYFKKYIFFNVQI